jgi:hypothetical protein
MTPIGIPSTLFVIVAAFCSSRPDFSMIHRRFASSALARSLVHVTVDKVCSLANPIGAPGEHPSLLQEVVDSASGSTAMKHTSLHVSTTPFIFDPTVSNAMHAIKSLPISSSATLADFLIFKLNLTLGEYRPS